MNGSSEMSPRSEIDVPSTDATVPSETAEADETLPWMRRMENV